ncbi:2OG-Fe(II) oxygenase [Colletotrichum higginsianum]|nr:2OG-Fe(II) oxygenase [Colletotrichum higginsianum]
MLDLEGDLDNDDERSFTEEEDVEDASDYYRTAAFLVKKKSVHRYMSHISPNSPSGYSFANTNTENMVEMVVDDMRDFMKNQDMGEHARPPILEVLRKALGPNESSRALTPVVVKWALKLKNMGLYQSAMMAAAKSGIEDILESAIKTACGFVEHHFGDVPGHIDWDKW